MNFADTSWPIVITESHRVIMVGRITMVEKPQLVNQNQTTSRATVHIERELTPGRWHGSREVTVAYRQLNGRASRMRAGTGGWNGVDIQPGAFVLIGLEEKEASEKPLELEAISQLSSVTDTQIHAVERALAIEAATDPQQRKQLLTEALTSEEPILMSYVHYSLGRMHRIPRSDAAALEMKMLLDRQRSVQQRLSAESALELELWVRNQPQDDINRNIIKVFFHVLAQGRSDMQSETIMSLYRLLVSDAPASPDAGHSYRLQLLRDVDPSEVRNGEVVLRGEIFNPSIRTQARQLVDMLSGMAQ